MADNADRAGELLEQRMAHALTGYRLPECNDDPYCEECGEEIPAARREAAPWAATCIECQGRREQRGRHVR